MPLRNKKRGGEPSKNKRKSFFEKRKSLKFVPKSEEETEEVIQILPYAPGLPSTKKVRVTKGSVKGIICILTLADVPDADLNSPEI